jgi:predicted  nucleic acid-binding Zn-ribbon protein
MVLFGLLTSPANAKDLAAELSAAESDASTARAALATAEDHVTEAEQALAPLKAQAESADQKADAAEQRVDEIEAKLTDARTDAAHQIRSAEQAYAEDVDEHDKDTASSVGFGIGALVLGVVALFWPVVRRLEPIPWLASHGWREFLAVLGSLVLLLLVGGSLVENDGIAPAIGGFLIIVSIGALVLVPVARHSLQIERGEATALTRQHPFPGWVPQVVAGVLAIVAIAAVLGALGEDDPSEPVFSPKLERLAAAAEGDPTDPPTQALAEAQQRAEPLVARASKLASARDEVEDVLSEARTDVRALQQGIASAEKEIDSLSALIAEQEAKAAQQAAREAEQAEEQSSDNCTPGYSPCLPPASDYDCSGGSGDGPEYTGQVSVSGSDPYDLDADGDGVGCE